jgi:hypothetical protein
MVVATGRSHIEYIETITGLDFAIAGLSVEGSVRTFTLCVTTARLRTG